ncbi:MAG: hypothetical protein JSV56_06880 [Methanomassiliicoccales archaeon]|nr:MAG: hypothetical protein JSV56_06880 [Methanomassiliicoccales archaeon]
MLKNRMLLLILPFLFVIAMVISPIDIVCICGAIDVADGTLSDWADAPLQLIDPIDEPSLSMTDLTFVAFDFDETWLYVRWDIYNDSTNPEVLYDMGINLSGNPVGTDDDWDIFVSAQVETISGIPTLTNISIRKMGSPQDIHIWNASDDGNMAEDGTLYLDPAPGAPPGNLSVEARFPLAYLGIVTAVILGQFRSHSSGSVNSAVKDTVPDSGYIALTVDNNPPEFGDPTATPNPQENGGQVNISVDVFDEIDVDTVWVNIELPGGGLINISMQRGSGDRWYLEDIFDDLGVYTYTICANDTCNNWNGTQPKTFLIRDTDGPVLDNLNVLPNPGENGEYVTISLDVEDDIEVDTVWINITYPNGTSINVTMDRGTQNQWYYSRPYIDLGPYTYTIWANDTQDNWNTLGPETFTIQDTDPPEILIPTALPDPQEMGGRVNISVDVVDDIDVEGVFIVIRYPNGTRINVSMKQGAGDEWYFDVPYNDPGNYAYEIHAKDTGNIWNNTDPFSFTIQDRNRPHVGDPKATPDPQDAGKNVNISVDVIDDGEIDEVRILITFPDGSTINASMMKGDDNSWYYNDTFDDTGNYTYTIWAVDGGGNWADTDPETFSIQPTTTPSTPSIPFVPPKDLYMSLLLIFWPLLLMLFTIVLERRYGFANRFKKDFEPVVSGMIKNSKGRFVNTERALDNTRGLITLSQRTGIPVEEYLMGTLTAETPPQIQDHSINRVSENIKEIKRHFK